ncbi:MAG: ribonuclease E/G [Geminicoccaceae bacterium]|jgi:ribonuclease E/ribonuclease G|nr:ribonuclease E/G [Geminicoccaceae bacterium]MCB9967458.1 ribonuclease E/G [Geminicoccaceae bacterium]HRY25319.1 ribonuclease E/G [Geminicoccaceae bacterium]
MTVELILDRLGDAVALAVVENDLLVDLWAQGGGPEAVEDRLFLARVIGLEPAVDGAFLDHGAGRPGFLAGKDARHRRGLAKGAAIGRTVEVGEWLVVQGMRAAEGDKGARLTTDIRLAAAGLVYRPHGSDIQLGRGIAARDREAMALRGAGLLDKAKLPGGLVLRRLAIEADDAALAQDLGRLGALWAKLDRLASTAERRSGPLDAGPSALARLLWRALDLAPVSLTVADDALKAEARRLVQALPEAVRPELELLDSGTSAFALTGVDEAIAEALSGEVPLDGGGRLLIQETAACVAIDVDGGGRPALDVNLAAAAEIGRLARLRNLGGTLIVDFVDLAGKAQRQRLDDAVRRAFRGDPLPVQTFPMSPLGIVQISRARRGASPLGAASRICPACGGSGRTAAGP